MTKTATESSIINPEGSAPLKAANCNTPASVSGRIGAPLFADKWSNAKCARIAAMITKGYSCAAIALEISDGTTPNEIASMVSNWGIRPNSSDHRRTYTDVPVPLAAKSRTALAEEAKRRGLELPALVATIAETVCRDDLFSAVLDA